jgi:O-antigen ligase
VGPAAEASHTSAQSRIAGLKHGFALMLDDPLSGVGPNNFRKTWYGDYGLQAHNLYGQVMGELGLLGVVAFFGFLLAVWWRLWRNARLARERGARARDPDEKRAMLFLQRLSSAGMMIILLMLFSGNFAHILYRYQWLLVAFFAVAGAGILEGSAAGSAVPRQAADEQSSMEFA